MITIYHLDSSRSERIIWLMEKVGWVKAVRWPIKERLELKRVNASSA
jgi:stearoyl-CoA desaturase (delta-9 desaturase)